MAQRGAAAPEHVLIHVGFGLHCFTRHPSTDENSQGRYGDARETREFDAIRYRLSRHLPKIVRDLANRRCSFGKDDNFVTVDIVDDEGIPICLAVFFNLKRWPRDGSRAVLLVVQSAYPLATQRKLPANGRIGFDVLVRHALKGTRPKPPR